tara:strand:+ start:378 stop:506 length:129 start_codon:yes stop_codon:yes gene_type:complete
MESDTITPYEMRYSETTPLASPVMDMNYSVCIPANGATFSPK